MNRYAIEIVYSDDAGGYIAVVPELPGCSAMGDTPEEALKEVEAAVVIWIAHREAEGGMPPEPLGRGLLDEIFRRARGGAI